MGRAWAELNIFCLFLTFFVYQRIHINRIIQPLLPIIYHSLSSYIKTLNQRVAPTTHWVPNPRDRSTVGVLGRLEDGAGGLF